MKKVFVYDEFIIVDHRKCLWRRLESEFVRKIESITYSKNSFKKCTQPFYCSVLVSWKLNDQSWTKTTKLGHQAIRGSDSCLKRREMRFKKVNKILFGYNFTTYNVCGMLLRKGAENNWLFSGSSFRLLLSIIKTLLSIWLWIKKKIIPKDKILFHFLLGFCKGIDR